MSIAWPTDPITVHSPASSANLGPGFDALGLALGLWDEYTLTVSELPGVRVHTEGQGAGEVPTDRTHLVARSLLAGLGSVGVTDVPGLNIFCRNRIPHRRGLGSSSAAIVGGLALAQAVLAPTETLLLDTELVAEATALEGHPDNVAAAALGGMTIAWLESGVGRAVSIPVHPAVRSVVFVPDEESATEATRALLPSEVSLADAVFNVGRAALAVHALTTDPRLLSAATADRLHQEARRSAYPKSLALVAELRASGVAAAISGAGPTVIALLTDEDRAARLAAAEVSGFTPMALPVAGGVRVD